MIANCPSCGTHYKHELPKIHVRARCGRCDATVDLARFRPYRIATAAAPRPEDAASAAGYSPIGLDHPALATPIARQVSHATTMPLPSQPKVDLLDKPAAGVVARAIQRDHEEVAPSRGRGRVGTFVLWVAIGAIAGTGISWALGGTTAVGTAMGVALGTAAGWGWLRWTSRK